MTTESETSESLAARVVALGEEGFDRASIVVALGLTEREMAAREAADDALAVAMQDAETAASAWLTGRMREQLLARWDWGLWLALMQWKLPERYGRPVEPAAQKAPNWRRWRPGIGFV
ncbi:MAG TPA: hypothetical protein VG248_02485 [Caulobacteraceae bacterium]|jgi:hypothetical protein|nr:hypothetical protein [Caulobacteraceae bacterium]